MKCEECAGDVNQPIVRIEGRTYDSSLTSHERERRIVQSPAEMALTQVGRALLESSARAVFLLELDLQFITCNAAGRMLMESDVLTIDHAGRLATDQEHAQRRLRMGLQELQRRGDRQVSDMASERIALQWGSSKQSTQALYGMLTSLTVAERRESSESRRIAILTIVKKRAVPGLGTAFLMSMFELTPAEAKLALLLLEGSNPRTIARDHRVSVETIRAQLKSIFSKTNTHRQSELLCLLIHLTCF